MAININASRSGTPLRIKFYDHALYDSFTKLMETKKVKGVFYARKHSNKTTTNYITQTGIKAERVEMILYTNDDVSNLKQDDFIVINNEKWLVMKQEEITNPKTSKKATFGTLIYIRK